MTSIVIKVSKKKNPSQLPADMKFVRVLHEVELPPNKRTTPKRQPQVRPLFPNHFSTFGRMWQMLSWLLNKLLNAANMTSVYNDHLWIANNHGFGDASTPRKNYFLLEDLDADKDLMVESLTCGGNILHVLGEMVFKTTSGVVPCYIVETLDKRTTPETDWLNERPWLITTATKLGGDGEPDRFPQGQAPNGFAPGVRHPLVCDTVRYPIIVIEKWRCIPWNESFVPDPYTVYNRHQSLLQKVYSYIFRQ